MITAVLAMIVPKFGLFINLIGAFACTALAFILPVRIYDLVHKDVISWRRSCFHVFLMTFGIVCGFISFVLTFQDLVKAFSEKDETGEEIAPNVDNEDTEVIVQLNQHPVLGHKLI